MTVYHADGDESISTAVVRALEAVTNTPAEELPVLYDAVDPDALDALFRDRDTEALVQFEHDGYRITVTGDREVRLEKAMAPPG